MATYGSVGGEAVIGGQLNTQGIKYKSTPVTITSWSYVTTTITLNVASHTFVAGDYIEVSGLTATTNIPNGVHLVTSVTTTTIVFTYALTPTGTAGVSSATVKGYAVINGRTNDIGEGQTWQDVKASRVAGVTYTNTTGKPIEVIVRGGVLGALVVYINGVQVASAYPGSGSDNGTGTLSIIVPNGNTYSFTTTSGVIYSWSELR